MDVLTPRTLEEAVRYAQALPDPPKARIDSFKKRLDKMSQTSSTATGQ